MSDDMGRHGLHARHPVRWMMVGLAMASVTSVCMLLPGCPHLLSKADAYDLSPSVGVERPDGREGTDGISSDDARPSSRVTLGATPIGTSEEEAGTPGAQVGAVEDGGAVSKPPRIVLESSAVCSKKDIELWVTASGNALDRMEVVVAREHDGATSQSVEEFPIASGESHELLFSDPGHVHVDIRLVDGEGRSDTASFDGLIDQDAPQVAFEGVQEGMSYRSSPVLWFTCDDENLFASWADAPGPSCLVEVMRNGEVVAGYSLGDLVRGFEGHSAGLAFSVPGEGRYSLYAVCADAAGNQTEILSGAFVVDGTAPDLTVSFDNDEVSNGSYYHAPRVATVSVADVDFDPRRCVLDTDGEVGAWHVGDSAHMVEVAFVQEGTHHLDVTVQDGSGNACEPFHSGEFTIDLTPPEVLIEGVSDHVSYSGDVRGALHVHDEHCDAEASTVELVGTASGLHEVALQRTGQTDLDCTLDGFPHVRSSDDIYTLRVLGSDLAGNETVQEVVFSVNRFGSTYRVMPESEDYLDGYKGSGQRCYPENIVIEEVNVDSLVERRVRVDHDGRVVELQEGALSGMSVAEGLGDSGFYTLSEEEGRPWHAYVYTIDGSTFEKEGAYRIQLHSVDAAGNISDSTLARSGVQVQLIMDLTAPEIWIDDAEAWQTYIGDTHRMTVRAFDNMSPVDLSVTLDGQEAVVPAGEEEVMIEIGADADRRHVVEACARDQAGNVSQHLSVPGIRVVREAGPEHAAQDMAGRCSRVLLGVGVVAGLVFVLCISVGRGGKRRHPPVTRHGDLR